jgi:hypothetical protein
LVRFSQSASSLNKIVSVIRPQSQEGDVLVGDKKSRFYGGNLVDSHNVFVNNSLRFEEDVKTREESWAHVVECFPAVKKSEFFDSRFNSDRNIIAINLQAAPKEFHSSLKSGIVTSSLNSDVSLKLNLVGTPATPLRVDSYLISDVRYFLPTSGSDLKVEL